VAGLFALVERRPPRRRGRSDDEESESFGKSLTVARAVKAYEGHSEKGEGNMSSVERRFLALLDSDVDQLSYRLRQMLLMVTRGQNAVAAPLDWATLLRDLQHWSSPTDWVRQKWAQEFYQPSDTKENQANEESPS
jgi:CRISPR type I-E-associated protein CasB/Cse2